MSRRVQMLELANTLDQSSQAMRQLYVYILSSRSGVLYVGVTSDLERRLYEHQHEMIDGRDLSS